MEKKLKILLFVPPHFMGLEETKRVISLIKQCSIPFEIREVKADEEWNNIKSKFLYFISIGKGIAIKQTRRTKSPYTQLVLVKDDIPIVFYPQKRGNEEITIEKFLTEFIRSQRFESLFEVNI